MPIYLGKNQKISSKTIGKGHSKLSKKKLWSQLKKAADGWPKKRVYLDNMQPGDKP